VSAQHIIFTLSVSNSRPYLEHTVIEIILIIVTVKIQLGHQVVVQSYSRHRQTGVTFYTVGCIVIRSDGLWML